MKAQQGSYAVGHAAIDWRAQVAVLTLLLPLVVVVLIVGLGVVLGAEVVVLGVLEVLVVAVYVHCEHEARTVWLVGEQTSNGT